MTPPLSTLVLEASLKDNQISVSLYERGSTVHPYEQTAFPLTIIDNLCEDALRLLNRANEREDSADDLSVDLKKTGQMLYDHLLTESVKLKLKNVQEGHLIVLIDENLVQIPWELLHDGEEFLCLRFSIGRLVKTRQSFVETAKKQNRLPLKMLFLSDPQGDLPGARQEAHQIRNMLDNEKTRVLVSVKMNDIPLTYVKKHIRDYDVIHYAGHTDYDAEKQEQSGWRLTDGRFTAEDVRIMRSSGSFPSFIFFNSCQSANEESWRVEKGFENQLFGLANAFLLSGVQHLIGTLWKIPDTLSLHFAREFYRQSIQGKTIGQAIQNARRETLKNFTNNSLIWASYILYGDPSTVLIKEETPVEEQTPSRASSAHDSKTISKKQVHNSVVILILILILTGLYFISRHFIAGHSLTTQKFIQPQIQENSVKTAWSKDKQISTADTSLRLADEYREKLLFTKIFMLETNVTKNSFSDRVSELAELYTTALQKAQDINETSLVALAWEGLAFTEKWKGDTKKAIDDYEQSARILEQDQNLDEVDGFELAVIYIDLARLYAHDQLNFKQALTFLQKLRQLFTEQNGATKKDSDAIKVIKRNLELLLNQMAYKGYEHSDFSKKIRELQVELE